MFVAVREIWLNYSLYKKALCRRCFSTFSRLLITHFRIIGTRQSICLVSATTDCGVFFYCDFYRKMHSWFIARKFNVLVDIGNFIINLHRLKLLRTAVIGYILTCINVSTFVLKVKRIANSFNEGFNKNAHIIYYCY